HFDFVLDAEVLQQVDSGFQVRIGIGKATTFAAMKKLRRMETKHRDIAEVSNADRVDLRLKGVRRIVDHTQPVPFGDSPDSMDVAGNSVDVNTQYPACPIGDQLLELGRVERHGLRIDIAEYRRDAVP